MQLFTKDSHNSKDETLADEKADNVDVSPQQPNEVGEVYDVVEHDAVFGDVGEEGPNYRNV